MVYWDHNATAPLRPQAKAAMIRALDLCGNPASVHSAGRAARAALETAREQVAHLAGGAASEVVFTSGGTEANALALRGAIMGAQEHDARITRLFVVASAHDSVRAAAQSVIETTPGLKLTTVPVNSQGLVDPAEFRALLMNGKGRVLVSLLFVNNETGVIEAVEALSDILRRESADGLLHVDAISSGHSAALFEKWGAHYLSLASHKIGGPQGAGALLVRQGAPFAPLFNGFQEQGRRAGTPNVAAMVGFGAAASSDFAGEAEHIAALRQKFEMRLRSLGAVIFGEGTARQPTTTCFALPPLLAEHALIALDLDGIRLSSGAACSSGKFNPSHVLSSMGVAESLARCALRASFGRDTREPELDEFFRALTKLLERRLKLAGAA